jgi:hypothetical protein
MTKKNKLLAVIWKLSRIPLQERRVLDIDIDEALAKISDEELEFYYNKLVKGV